MTVPEPQRGILRWVMVAVVIAIFVALMLAKTDESDESMAATSTAEAPDSFSA